MSSRALLSHPNFESNSVSSPTVASPATSLEDLDYYEPESDASSPATDLFDNKYRDDESTISSAESASRGDLDLSSFDSRLRISPQKSQALCPSSFPRIFGYGRGIGEAAGIWDFEAALDEQLYCDMSLLSKAALCLQTRIIKDINVRNGVSYPSSLNGEDLLIALRACIEEEHDDTDTPLPLDSLVPDIARSLQRQFLFCKVGPLG